MFLWQIYGVLRIGATAKEAHGAMGEYAELFIVQALATAVQFVINRLFDWLFPRRAAAALA
jgi:hypothetical protein